MLALVAASGLAVRAEAQLDASIVNASTISAAQQQKITDHVKTHMAELSGGDPEKVKKAKNALTTPTLEPAVSVPFRLAYSQTLMDEKLATLCKDTNETVAINALRIAGEVAENQTIGLVQDGMKDKRSAVRYAAVFGAMRTFDQIAAPGRSVAATVSKLESLVRDVAETMNKDKEEPLVIDGASRALLAGAKVTQDKWDVVGKQSAVEVCKGLGKRVATATADDLVLIESAQRAVGQFGDILAGAKGPQFDKDARRETAGLAGDLAAWVVRQINAGKVEQSLAADETADKARKAEQRKFYGAVLATAENAVLSAVKASGATPPAARLVPAFSAGDRQGDANVVVQTRDWLIRDILAKDPFSLPATRFVTK